MLPGHLSGDEADLCDLLENEALLDISNLEYGALRFAAMADGNSRANIARRVRDIRSAPLSPEERSRHGEEVEKAFADVKDRIGQGPMADSAARLLPQYKDFADGFLDRAGKIGPRAALLEFLETVGVDEDKRAKLMTGELSNLSVFQSQVRYVAHSFLNASTDEEQSLTRTIEPADCPGSWLEWALRSRVRTASADPKPNHLSDAERLAYLPYVDLLITDREMTELTNQIRRDESTPDQVRIARAPQAVSSSLAALQNALNSVCGNG